MKTPVVIIGGGPGGSAAAMYLAREGIESVIVERETFPRYHVGESMTGEAGAVLRDLGLGDAMNERRHPVKHGVKVYGPDGRHSWFVPVMARDADWQLSEQTTWQVRRSEFDGMMLATAIERGAKLVPGRATKALRRDDGSVYGVEVRVADGGTMQIESELVLDCSGQATFLAGQGVTGPKYLGAYDKQIALFSQVAGSVRDMGEARDQKPGNTLIFYSSKYHWSWFIPLDDEVMSVGVVTPASYFLDRNETKKGYLTAVLHELHPEMDRRLPGDIELVEDVHVIPNYSYQVKRFCGKGFMCIGDAHRFVDPIFSFGLYVTMKEAQLAAPVIKEYLEGGARRDQANPFSDYQVMCEHAIDVLEDSVDLFWEHPFAFAVFVHHRYRHDLIDVFAGRIYERQPSIGVEAFRKMLKRERTYDSEDIYSMPIGSRYHPERAPIWEVASAVESTEKWVVEGMDGWMAAS